MSRPKTSPIPPEPISCSPQVFFNSFPLLLMASMGPTPSMTRMGMARKVRMLHPVWATAEPTRPAVPPRLESSPSTSPTVAEMAE